MVSEGISPPRNETCPPSHCVVGGAEGIYHISYVPEAEKAGDGSGQNVAIMAK